MHLSTVASDVLAADLSLVGRADPKVVGDLRVRQ